MSSTKLDDAKVLASGPPGVLPSARASIFESFLCFALASSVAAFQQFYTL